MKKILFSISILLVAIVTMAYLYFSRLNTEHEQTDISLYAAVSKSGFIFSFENDKSILDIFKGQHTFPEILGPEKFHSLQSLNNNLLAAGNISQLISKQFIYLSFIPGKGQEMDFLLSSQLTPEGNKTLLLKALTASGLRIDSSGELHTLILKDSSVFYLGIKDHLLLLSNVAHPVKELLDKTFDKKDDQFVAYIKSNSRLTKNSVAQLYLNFNLIPALLKTAIPGKPDDVSSLFSKNDAFAALTYNYSKDKVLFTGATAFNGPHAYEQLFTKMQAQKITINTILPENTANYQVYAIDHYNEWKKNLDDWFTHEKQDKKVKALINAINTRYHLNPDALFPKYFGNQLLSFQMSNGEKIGAINLSNGDKLAQLLIDLSEDYSEDIKLFREADLLYCYFGQPFKAFRKPYFTIIDNYLIFANQTAPLQAFLNDYRNNRLLINKQTYLNAGNQLPNTANINFYIDRQNSRDLFSKHLYPAAFRYLESAQGLKNYDAFVYQLSGDNGKFQSNILLSKSTNLEKDSLILQP